MFKKFIEKYKKNKLIRKRESLVKRANNAFQITELDGRIWLTHDGYFICPCEMFNDEPIGVVERARHEYISTMERMYVKRNNL